MTDARILGEAVEYDDIVEMYRQRVAEIGLTNEMIDHLSGLQSGYSGKLFGPAQTRSLGPASWGLLNHTLGLKVLIVVDEESTALMRSRWEKRGKPSNMPNRLSMKAAKRFMPLLASEMGRRAGLLSAQGRMKKLTPWQRRAIAKRAAKARWKRKPAAISSAPTTI